MTGILDLIRAERERRERPALCVIWRELGDTDGQVEAHIEEARREGRIGPNTTVTIVGWKDAAAA